MGMGGSSGRAEWLKPERTLHCGPPPLNTPCRDCLRDTTCDVNKQQPSILLFLPAPQLQHGRKLWPVRQGRPPLSPAPPRQPGRRRGRHGTG